MTIYSQIDSNRNKTFLIMILFVIFIALIGYIFGEAFDPGYGITYLGFALVFSGATTFFSYYFSDKIILTISGAHQIEEEDHKQLFHTVENLCIGAGLPMPKIYMIDDTAPNAFATGRDPKHAVVCVTNGLIDKLEDEELEGVIAHELSHVKNYDMRLMSIVTVLVGSVTLLADWFGRRMLWSGRRRRREGGGAGAIIMLIALILALLSPIIAMLMQLALSRNREYLADASAALLTRYPEGLARSLEKIATDREPLEAANKATANLYIINPLKGQEMVGWFAGLFNTHPPVAERVARLRAM